MIFVGGCAGSFVNCVQLRLQNKSGSLWARSACPECGHTLGVFDLFPILSYLFLRGRCRYCKAEISPRYVCVEIVFGFTYALLLAVFGFSWRLIEYLMLFTLLGASSLCDLATFEVPDSLAICEAAVFPLFLLTYPHPLERLKEGLLGAVIYGGAMLLLSLAADKIYKKDTLGGADIKLIAVLGLFFGPTKMLLLVILSCLVGLLLAVAVKAGLTKAFPFIPSLAIGALITAAVGEQLIELYLGLFHMHIH